MTSPQTRVDRLFWLALTAIVAAGAWFRFRILGGPSLWLDELLNYDIVTAAANEPWHAWLAGFEVENGPLYYALQLAARVASDVELASRLAPAIIGTATIALIGIAGRRISSMVGIVAAIVLAASPLHAYYSREGRAYSLLMFFATLICLAFLGESRRSIAAMIGALVGAAFSAATAAPLIVSAAGAALIQLPFSRRRAVNVAAILGSLIAAAILALHYSRFPRPKPALGMPPLDFDLISKIINGFTLTALEVGTPSLLAWAVAGIGVFGGAMLIRRDRAGGIVLVAMALLPVILTLASLSIMRHWFSVRYVSPALPPFVLLVAVGVESMTRFIRKEKIGAGVAVATALGIGAVSLPNTLHEPLQKVDWRGAASYIAAHVKPGDAVVSSNAWSMICSSFYLRQIGSPVTVQSADESPEQMKGFMAGRHAWIIEGGWHSNLQIVEWLTNYCEVWTSPTGSQFESLRVRFYPDCRSFLASRVTPGDVALLQRWFVEDRGSRLEMTDYDKRFLLEGWSDPEVDPAGPTFRWVDGRRASVMLPTRGAGARLRFRARSLGYPNARPQELRLRVNGVDAFATTLTDQWSDHEATSRSFREGVNEVAFEFSRATRPADIDPKATDERALSAAFDFIEVSDARRE